MDPATWRIQCGEHGWIREIWRGQPIVTARYDEVFQWPTRAEAEAAADALPASPVPARVVPGRATMRAFFDPRH